MAVTINGSAGVTTNSGAVYNGLQTDTAKSATSTSVDFTGIPSWVKRITVMLNGVSGSGTSAFLIQIGAGSVTTSGYLSSASGISTGGSPTVTAVTNGFNLIDSAVAARAYTFVATLTLQTTNTWCLTSNGHAQTVNQTTNSAGSIALGGTLDRVRITTVNGTDTFDAGTINIIYE